MPRRLSDAQASAREQRVPGGRLVGPWEDSFWFSVDGPWRSKSNYRRSAARRQRAGGWNAQKSFTDQVAQLARVARPEDWELGDAKAPVAERPGIVAFLYAESLLDVPNLSKSALDALEHIAFHTDASVRYCASMGPRVKGGDGIIALARVVPGASEEAVLDAAQALERSVLEAWAELQT